MDLQCPFCNSSITTSKEWIVQNERVFCDTCCKSFEVNIKNMDSFDKLEEEFAENEGTGEEA